ncbi:hypothetical protein [Lacticaseibacillus hegangensis]|uniref:Uncharacterized protein n=2 Tax=Lacticaseibacillus hegangensis TaxID=2486010 RepID=A0ABW4CYU5_9LACO
MAKSDRTTSPDWVLILLLAAGYLIPQLGLQWLHKISWLALAFPVVGALCLYLALKRDPQPMYKRLIPWGFVLAAGVLVGMLFFA